MKYRPPAQRCRLISTEARKLVSTFVSPFYDVLPNSPSISAGFSSAGIGIPCLESDVVSSDRNPTTICQLLCHNSEEDK